MIQRLRAKRDTFQLSEVVRKEVVILQLEIYLLVDKIN